MHVKPDIPSSVCNGCRCHRSSSAYKQKIILLTILYDGEPEGHRAYAGLSVAGTQVDAQACSLVNSHMHPCNLTGMHRKETKQSDSHDWVSNFKQVGTF
jgi:hypothetical protein